MAARFTVELYDPNTVVGGLPARVAILDDWNLLQYHMALNNRGDSILDISGNSPHVATFLANLDLMLVVYREDPANGIARYVDGEVIHRTNYQYQEARGSERFTSYGRGLTDLLSRRIIAYPSGDPGADKEGPTESVLKEYVDENLGPGAVAPPREADGVTANFSVQADGATGDLWTGSRSWRNLLDVAQEIAAYDPAMTGLGFDFLVVSKLATQQSAPGSWLEFQTGRPWGLDRTVGQIINPPAVFSTGAGNMLLPQYSESHIEEKSRVYVLGPGSDADRKIWTEEDAAMIAASPWNLAEMVRNANLEEEDAGLETVGLSALAEVGPRKTFTFQVLQTSGLRYGRDYSLGDLITVSYKGVTLTRKIVGVTVRVTAEGGSGGQREEIRLDLGEVAPYGGGIGR